MTKIIYRGEPLSPMFKPGTILWRQVGHTTSGVFIDDFDWGDPTESGHYVCKMDWEGGFMFEPTVHPATYKLGERTVNAHGLVVFVDKRPAQAFTHLLVTGVSRAMREKWDPSLKLNQVKGQAIFATPAEPYALDAYRNFKRQMFLAVKSHLNASHEEKVKIAASVVPTGADTDERVGERRLVTSWVRQPLYPTGQKEPLIQYAHLSYSWKKEEMCART